MGEGQGQSALVRAGYNVLSRAYRADIADDATQGQYAEWLGNVRDRAPACADVLDRGCGNGIPAAKWLSDNGFRVTGVDLSDTMVERARELVPEGTFLRGDVTSVDEVAFDVGSFDAVVSFFALIHVPVTDQPGVLARAARWLRPGGLFVATVGHTGVQLHRQQLAGWHPHVMEPPRGRDLSSLDRVGRTRNRPRALRAQGQQWAHALHRHPRAMNEGSANRLEEHQRDLAGGLVLVAGIVVVVGNDQWPQPLALQRCRDAPTSLVPGLPLQPDLDVRVVPQVEKPCGRADIATTGCHHDENGTFLQW